MSDKSASEMAGRYGYSTYLVDRYIQMLGPEDTLRLLEANEKGLTRCILRETPSN